MKTSSIKFTIGINKTKHGTIISGVDSHNGIQAICNAIATYFGGYTKTMAYGGWVNNGELIEECAVVIEAALTDGLRYVDTRDIKVEVNKITELAKKLLDQECVLVQYIAGQSELA